MNWFAGCNTADEVRNRYHELVRKHHPDAGGRTESMVDINLQYEAACRHFDRAQAGARSQEQWRRHDSISEVLRQKLVELARLDGITIEVCGLWIWVGGNTYAVREQLKRLGLRYASKKQLWYFAGVPSNGRRTYTMDEIRDIHGSRVVDRSEVL